jgi:hypothetical protein
MKKWIALMTCLACVLSSVRADEPITANPDEVAAMTNNDQSNKPGKAASDGSTTAGSGARPYVFAAGALAIAAVVVILLTRGHHHHHHHSHSHG